MTWPRSPRSRRVAPRDRAPLAGAGDDVALVVGVLLLAAQGALEVGPPPGAVLLGDDDVVPVAAEQVALAVAEQLAAVAVEQVDRLVGAQDQQDRAGDVEVVLGARLGELARGDVDQQALAGHRPPGVVAHDRVALPHPDDAAVGPDQAVLAVGAPALIRVLERPALLLEHLLAVLGVQALEPQLVLGHEALGGEAEQVLDLRRHVLEREADLPPGDVRHRRYLFRQPAIAVI